MLKQSLCALAFAGLLGSPSFAADKCMIEISGNDQMQYDKKEVKLPAECAKSNIKVEFKHSGKLPLAAMGHNIVIVGEAKLPSILPKYTSAGADPVKLDAVSEQLKASGEVYGYTKLVGGSSQESTVIIKGKLEAGKKYQYFCSFPGHFALMTGTIELENAGTASAAAPAKTEKKK